MTDSEILKVLRQAERRGNGDPELTSDFGWGMFKYKHGLDLCTDAADYWKRFGNRLWSWTVADYHRRRRMEQLVVDDEVAGREPEETFDYGAAKEKVLSVLHTLPRRQREAILLRMGGERLTVAQGMALLRATRNLKATLGE